MLWIIDSKTIVPPPVTINFEFFNNFSELKFIGHILTLSIFLNY